MIDKQQDFLTLTGAARRARSEGYDITDHVSTSFTRIWYILSRRGSRLNRAWSTSSPAPATNSTIRPRHPPDAGGIFEASSKQ